MTSGRYSKAEPILLPVYPRVVLLALLDLGYEEEQIFAGLDITADQLHDEKYRLTIAQHERFILRALKLTGDPHLAIRLGQQPTKRQTNLALLAVANSGQISKALYLTARYFKMVTRVFSIRSFDRSERAVMEIDLHLEHDLVSYFAMSAFALFLDRFFRKALGGAHVVQRLELRVAKPVGFDDVAERFPFEVVFGQQDTRLLFDDTLLDEPMEQADPQTVRLLMEMSERQLDEAEAEMSLVGAVKALLIEQIASPPKLEAASRQLGLSSRSLRRRLAESGTSYQKLLDGVRARMARQLITETTTPISTIADELGFGNPSDFARAFKRWTGQTPSSLRAR